MRTPHRSPIGSLALALSTLAALASSTFAGPLNPPAGAIASSGKTLTDVEPRTAINATNTPSDANCIFRITQPGSYYLTGNITGLPGRSGIEIAADNVTVDLMGFTLQGVPGSLDGITIDAGYANAKVRNGTVNGFSQDGVDLAQVAGGKGGVIEDVAAASNSGRGIVGNTGSLVRRCTATANGGGIEQLLPGKIESCVVNGGASSGIRTGAGVSVVGCEVSGVAGFGINAGENNVISDCVVSSCAVDGIAANHGTMVRNSSARSCGSNGLHGINGVEFVNCTSRLNGLDGIVVEIGCRVIDCTSRENTQHGINASDSTLISGCTVNANTGDGIRVTLRCSVLNNNCMTNGFGAGTGAGVRVTGSGNRLEGNHCVNADTGIEVTAASNVIMRNTCGGNTINWAVQGGNTCFVIVNGGGPAINGNSGGVAPTSSDPSANFTF